MAGFQKFPVPKAAYIDFWNYNKKWLGNTLFSVFGGFLFFLSANRYVHNRMVKIRFNNIENKRWCRKRNRSKSRTCPNCS